MPGVLIKWMGIKLWLRRNKIFYYMYKYAIIVNINIDPGQCIKLKA